MSHWRIRKFADTTVHTHPNSQRIQKFALWRPYWEKNVDTNISGYVSTGLKSNDCLFIRFQKVIFKCFFLLKMRTPRSNKRLRCTKKTNNNNKKETQWNGRFSRKLRRPSSKCNTSPSHLKQLRQSLII